MPKQQETKTQKGGPEPPATGASPTSNQATSTSGPNVISQARETASNVAGQAGNKITSRLDAQKDRAAEGLSSIAEALRQTSQRLREENQQSAAHEYLDSATNQVERVVNYVRSTDVRGMVGQVEQFARRQPALFLGGAFVLGLLGARFLKSSGQTDSAYKEPTPRNQSLVPSGSYAGTPGGITEQDSNTRSAEEMRTSATPPARPTARRGGV